MKKTRLEKSVEKSFLRELKKRWPTAKARKMNGYGHRSWHDRLIFLPKGAIALIEFKRVGEGLSPGQEYLHAELKQLGHRSFVCDDSDMAIAICEQAIEYAAAKNVRKKL